jgi:hypothetical protein
MSSPKHLWSGDWEFDSAAAAEELARRRARVDEPVETPPEEPLPPARPSLVARFVAGLRDARRRYAARERRPRRVLSGRNLRTALLVMVLVLLTAGVAFGTTLLLNSSGGQTASVADYAHSMLGIDVAGSPTGIVVTHVVPGSPAQAAGIQQGDLIDQINNQPVGTVDGVSAALAGMHAGNTVDVQFSRGFAIFTTQATLAAGSP